MRPNEGLFAQKDVKRAGCAGAGGPVRGRRRLGVASGDGPGAGGRPFRSGDAQARGHFLRHARCWSAGVWGHTTAPGRGLVDRLAVEGSQWDGPDGAGRRLPGESLPAALAVPGRAERDSSDHQHEGQAASAVSPLSSDAQPAWHMGRFGHSERVRRRSSESRRSTGPTTKIRGCYR